MPTPAGLVLLLNPESGPEGMSVNTNTVRTHKHTSVVYTTRANEHTPTQRSPYPQLSLILLPTLPHPGDPLQDCTDGVQGSWLG